MEEAYQTHQEGESLKEAFSVLVEKDQWAEVHQHVQHYESIGWTFYYASQTSEKITVYFQRPYYN